VKFLLDQNRSWRLAEMLKSLGHDAIHVSQLGLSSSDDSDVLAVAELQGRVLISADTDFTALLALRAAHQPSVILFRSRSGRSAEQQFVLLRELLPLFEEDLAVGSVIVITDDRVRARRLPLLGE